MAAITRFILAQSWSLLLFYGLIGLLLFALPALKDFSPQLLTGYIFTVVYLLGPLGAATNALPALGTANVALHKVEALGLSLTAHAHGENPSYQPDATGPWKDLRLAEIVYAYEPDKGERGFTLGPISLTIHPGELIFIAGGNGSGKSTLAKLVGGLYVPKAGEIRLNERPITEANREWYRQHFAIIFSDCYLFDGLLGLTDVGLDTRAQDYLVQLQLEHRVRIENGVFSSTALSQGQRKRLALLTAYLEDRPIYLFDEWAADQDQQFKAVFYTRLLPELRNRGKAVLVISHDERYFHLADRLIKLDEGRLGSSSA